MSCSVFCAQFALQGLTNAGRADASIRMMTSTAQRSWLHMIELGAGAVMEAWDPALKSNTSFSHPWASSPVVNVTKGIFGLAPAAPGWSRFTVAPQPGTLGQASLRTPTVRGEVAASFTNTAEDGIVLQLTAPANTVAAVTLPRVLGGRDEIVVDGTAVPTTVDGELLHAEVGSGSHEITVPQPLDTAPHTAFDVPQFPLQAQGTIGPVRTVVVENTGVSDLRVTRVRIKDADGLSAGDFVVADETCSDGDVAPRATCDVLVRFAPGRADAVSHANLVLTDNTPAGSSSASLSATSGGLPQGPKGDDGERGSRAIPARRATPARPGRRATRARLARRVRPDPPGPKGDSGATGPKGDTGATGAKGDRGAPGRDATVRCKLVKTRGKQRIACTVSYAKAGKATKLRATARARLTRNGRTVASGRVGALRTTRAVARGGRYTLRDRRARARRPSALSGGAHALLRRPHGRRPPGSAVAQAPARARRRVTTSEASTTTAMLIALGISSARTAGTNRKATKMPIIAAIVSQVSQGKNHIFSVSSSGVSRSIRRRSRSSLNAISR